MIAIGMTIIFKTIPVINKQDPISTLRQQSLFLKHRHRYESWESTIKKTGNPKTIIKGKAIINKNKSNTFHQNRQQHPHYDFSFIPA